MMMRITRSSSSTQPYLLAQLDEREGSWFHLSSIHSSRSFGNMMPYNDFSLFTLSSCSQHSFHRSYLHLLPLCTQPTTPIHHTRSPLRHDERTTTITAISKPERACTQAQRTIPTVSQSVNLNRESSFPRSET
jgi:hypothetical protein